MNSVEEWYKQWNSENNSMVNEFNEIKKNKIEKLKQEIIKNKNNYENPVYKKYAQNETKSIVDISYIYDKIIDGVNTIKLISNKEKKTHTYEYGFNKQNQCLYRKEKNTDKIDRLYVYKENSIYELSVIDIKNNDLTQISVTILGEYSFDNNNKPIEVIRHYGILNYEHYNWLNESICMIDCGIKNYILIIDSLGVSAIFQNINLKNVDKLFSYHSQNYVHLNNDILLEEKLSFDKGFINYACLKDINGKLTEYRLLDIYGRKYLVSTEYIRTPMGFSYKKAKEVYQKEILEFIKRKIDALNFEVQYINIQYFNYGYSIIDIFIGFDDIYCEDVHSMKVTEDFIFSDENKELIMNMNRYINDKMYYESFKKVMESLKKCIEEKYCIKVLLIEISD